MQQEYRHSQVATLMIYLIGLIMLIGIVAISIISVMVAVEPVWILPVIGLLTVATLGGCLAIFYKLTVEVKDGVLSFWFGTGLIRKNFPVREIVTARPVRNRWWHGWGIHGFGGGTLYNVSGFDAVEIELVSGKKLRIGTDEPQELTEAINEVLGS